MIFNICILYGDDDGVFFKYILFFISFYCNRIILEIIYMFLYLSKKKTFFYFLI